jgi:hypothetical protein
LRTFKQFPGRHTRTEERLLYLEPEKRVLYRLGGVYAICRVGIQVNDTPLFWEETGPDGVLLFSFDLNGDDSGRLLRVRQNSLSVDELQFWDFHLNTRGNHLIARRRKGDIFLDLHIAHVTISELKELATRDGRMGRTSFLKRLQPERRGFFSQSAPASALNGTAIETIRNVCLLSDDRVTLIDFRTATFRSGAAQILVRNGLAIDKSRFEASFFCVPGGVMLRLNTPSQTASG